MKQMKRYCLVLPAFLLVALIGLYGQESSQAEYVGQETCLECHSDQNPELTKNFSYSAHGKLEEFAQGCESCHGPGSLHIEEADPATIVRFSGESEQDSQICIKCHKSGAIMRWSGSEHDIAGVQCTACHSVHQGREVIDGRIQQVSSGIRKYEGNHVHSLKSPDPELCYSCHSRHRAQSSMMSHHPIFEGKMVCSDCHNSHGGNRMMNNESMNINDLCLKCHPQYQGPFVYEHEAVTEECTVCHTSHGSVVDNLLRKTEPFLCYQCHSIHTSIRIHQDVKNVSGKKCSYCHPKVHGSNSAPHLGIR